MKFTVIRSPSLLNERNTHLYDGEVGEYDGEVGEYDGDVGLSEQGERRDFQKKKVMSVTQAGNLIKTENATNLYDGEVGEYEGDVGLYEGDVGLYDGDVGE